MNRPMNMPWKRTILTLCLWLALCHAAPASEQEVPRAEAYICFGDERLEGLLRLAAEGHPSVLAAMERIKQAQEEARLSASALGPTLSVGGIARSEPDRELYNASLNLVQTLYAGGSLRANACAARLALSAAAAEGIRKYQDTLKEVRLRYYECLRAWGHVQVSREAVRLGEEHLGHAEKLFKGGMVPRGDVLRVKVSIAQGRQELVSAQCNFEMSFAALERATGAGLNLEDLQDALSQEAIEALVPPVYVVSGDRTASGRPELRAYEFYAERAKQLLRAAMGERAPRVALSGRLNTTRDDSSATDDRWYAQLEVQWTLYDGQTGRAQKRKAKAAAQEMLYALRDMTFQIDQEIRQALSQLRASETRFALAKEQTTAAREAHRMMLQRYALQMSSNVDVIDAKQALIQTHAAYVDAVFDIAAAQVGLVHALGVDVPYQQEFRVRETLGRGP